MSDKEMGDGKQSQAMATTDNPLFAFFRFFRLQTNSLGERSVSTLRSHDANSRCGAGQNNGGKRMVADAFWSLAYPRSFFCPQFSCHPLSSNSRVAQEQPVSQSGRKPVGKWGYASALARHQITEH